MLFADTAQLIVIGPGPAGGLHRMLGPFMKGLSQKLGPGSAELNGSRPATRYRYRRNASGALHLMSIPVTLAVSHRCQ